MEVVLLGSGNVATHLGHALLNEGHKILQVYSRAQAHADALARTLRAQAISDFNTLTTQADGYIIAVKDDSIASVVAQLPSPLRGVVMHTAGSVGIEVFGARAVRYGVLYPVQTFSKAKVVDFSTIPVAVEGSDEETYGWIARLAGSLSGRVFRCDSKQRLSIHVAAVFACNFTNHLYSIAADLLEEYGLDVDLLRPLILETAEKVMDHQPRDVQTGPAIRNDERTMQKHMELLENQPELEALYEALSSRIRENNHF